MKIKEIPLSKLNHISVDKKPRGLFLAPSSSGGWWACDNRNNQAYEMKFPTRDAAEKWLNLCEGGCTVR